MDSNRLDALLDSITSHPAIRRLTAFLDIVTRIPLHTALGLFAVVWGAFAIYTRPFSFAGAENILESFANKDVWAYGVFAIGFVYLYSVIAVKFKLYITMSILQCVVWWLIFLSFVLGGVPSAGVTAYGFIAVLATVNLMRFGKRVDLP